MASSLGGVMKEERLKAGMTQAQLAKALHTSRQAISGYETGAVEMPHDIACEAIKVLNSARLQYQVCFDCPANLMTTPWLDVDCHPVVVKHKLIEELREALSALVQVDLTNKASETDLTALDKEKLEYALEQIWDCIPAFQMLIGLAPKYGFGLSQQKTRHYEKLRNKRYLRYRGRSAKVVAL